MVPAWLVAPMFGALAPQGFVPRLGRDGLTIERCSGSDSASATEARTYPRVAGDMTLQAARTAEPLSEHENDRSDRGFMQPCAFASVGMPTVRG